MRGRRHARAGRWADAARSFEAALARDNRSASWHAYLGQARAQIREWEGAAAAYEAATARDPHNAKWHARLGHAHWRTQQWVAAADAYERAAWLADDDPEWLARAAQARRRTLEQQAASLRHRGAPPVESETARGRLRRARRLQRAQWAEALSRDPSATDLDRRLLAAHPERFPARREIAHLIADGIDEIRSGAHTPDAIAEAQPKVYVFWAQGIAHAPAIVKLCHTELRRLHAADDILVLDSSRVDHYVTVPDDVRRRIGGDWTKLSDVLRLELLSRYGGIWMDATCLPRVRMLDVLAELVRPSGIFAFTTRRARPASWFLASRADNYMIAMMRESHYVYWRRYEHLLDYYLFHHIFEALYHVDERFHDLWKATPRLHHRSASAFANAMLGPYDAARFEELLNGSFVHKLTYKYDERAARGNTMLSRLLREGAPVGTPPPLQL